MDAKKCDRCGGYYDFDEDKVPMLKNNELYLAKFRSGCLHDRMMDLCPKCSEGLVAWFNDIEKGEKDVQVTVEDSKKKRVRRSKVDGKSAN